MQHKLLELSDGRVGNGDNDLFNSFSGSFSEDEFYEEDIFQNHPIDEDQKDISDNECDSDRASYDFETEQKSELGTSYATENCDSGDLNKELPPPTTDWESIDHRLNLSSIKSGDTQDLPDPKVINRLSIGPDYLQLCFEDDNTLSDDGGGHNEKAEIKEYMVEDYCQNETENDKHDSGCILKDNGLNLEPIGVKIIKPEDLESTEISDEATTQVLLELESVCESRVNDRKSLRKKLERFSIRHLEMQIRDLKLKVKGKFLSVSFVCIVNSTIVLSVG